MGQNVGKFKLIKAEEIKILFLEVNTKVKIYNYDGRMGLSWKDV